MYEVLNLRHVHFLFDATLNILKKRSRQATHVFPGRLTTKFYKVLYFVFYQCFMEEFSVLKKILNSIENLYLPI